MVHDLYGINHATSAAPEECVICLSEVRDTVLVPCRHLCVCHHCAQVLRYQSNKCPICRATARAMLRVDVGETPPPQGETPHPDEEAITLLDER